MSKREFQLEDRLRELNAMLKPFVEHIRNEERRRCATIACSHRTWDGEQPTRANVKLWAALLEHGQSIAAEIDPVWHDPAFSIEALGLGGRIPKPLDIVSEAK